MRSHLAIHYICKASRSVYIGNLLISAKNFKKLIPKHQNRKRVYKIVKVESKYYVSCYI